jgi:hypoxanthine phosphoribosyltransferase
MEKQFNEHKTLIDSAQIYARVHELARTIERDYADSDDLVLVCVLSGAKKFFQALSMALEIPHRQASVKVSSYNVGTYISDGNVTVRQPLNADIRGADVLVIEDIIDTGYSMHTVLDLLAMDAPRTMAVCSLLSKPSRRVIDVPIDYLGFSIDDHFVFGYGIDVDQKYRELGYIGYFE